MGAKGLVKRDYWEEHPAKFFDEALDDDEVDLAEWAFWQGYCDGSD